MDDSTMEKLTTEIRDALTNAKEQLASFESDIFGKDITVFVGNTRSGKSTLINYLLGNRLEAFIDGRRYKLTAADESAGPQIGHGTASITATPRIYLREEEDARVLVDTPGFSDNRGEAQEIVNAIFLSKIRQARTCKFVLTSDINEIEHDNVSGFVNLFVSLDRLVPHGNLHESLSLVVTKDAYSYTRNGIAELLRKQVLDSDLCMCDKGRDLIRYFAKNISRIGLFQMPEQEGEVTEEIALNIEGAISNSTALNMHVVQVQPTISAEARAALLQIHQEFKSELQFTAELDALLAEHRNYFTVSDYVFASTDEELVEITTYMFEWTKKFKTESNQDYTNIQTIRKSISDLIQSSSDSSEVYKMLTLFDTLESVGLSDDSFKLTLIENYRKSLREVTAKIKRLVNKINEEEDERSNLNIMITASAVGAGVTGTAGVVAGGVALVGALEIGALGAAIGIGTIATAGILGAVVGVGAAAASVAAAVTAHKKHKHIQKRKKARILQGRP